MTTPNLSAAERWVIEQLAEGDHHLAELGWLGGDEYQPQAAIEVLQSLLAREYVEVRQCYEGDSWSRLLSADEAKAAVADETNCPRVPSGRPHWYEGSATESGLVALLGPSKRPHRESYLP
jgi:hypothetical protein